jgi:hypothetical protein
MHDEKRGDLLFLLALGESATALYAAYVIVLLALHHSPWDEWVPHFVVFTVSAVALIFTSLLADLHARRSIKH